MENMYAADAGPGFSFVRPDGRTFYDFQDAAVNHCVERIKKTKRAVLALDTGLGKTCVVRSIVDRLGVKALVVVPGGLVRQVVVALARFPWESAGAPSAVVIRAETGRELASALTQPHDILVANRALRFSGSEMKNFGLLVVDEVHQHRSAVVVRKLGGAGCCFPRVSTLFVTASPESSWMLPQLVFGNMRSWASDAEWEQEVFLVKKTPRVQGILGVARPRPLLLDLPLTNSDAYDAELMRMLERPMPASAAVRLTMSVGFGIPRLLNSCRRCLRLSLDHMDHAKLSPELLVDAMNFAESSETSGDRSRWGLSQWNGVCGCCGLTSGERLTLARFHSRNTPDPPPPWIHSSLGVTSVVVRFPTKRALEDALQRHPVPSPMASHILTSDKSASYRARLVQRFAGRDGQKMKLTVLNRAARNGTAPELLLKVCALGMGTMFLSFVEQCLAKPRLLLADATVDVGFDLHRHVDGIYVPRLPPNRSELQQIVGRVCRIAAERNDHGTIDVISHRYLDSIDDILWHHLENGDNS
jgi:hypothetical protein